TAAELVEALRALSPGSFDLDEAALTRIDQGRRSLTAATYFRGAPGGPAIARSVPFPQQQAMALAGTVQPDAHTPAVPSRTLPSEGTPTAATTGPGLVATTASAPKPRTAPMIAIAIACVVGGGAGVWAFTRPQGTAAVAPPPPNVGAASGPHTPGPAEP